MIINYLEIYKNDNKTKFRIALKDKLLTERESQDCYYEKEIRLFHKRNVRFQLSNTGKEHRNKLQKRFRMKIKESNKEFSLLLRNCRLDHSRGNCLNLAISENVYVSVKKTTAGGMIKKQKVQYLLTQKNNHIMANKLHS